MNKNLFLIHGAWASPGSFNYIVKKTLDDCPVGRIHTFRYDCQKEDIHVILEKATLELLKIQENGLETVIVGHSLGGLLALNLSQLPGISKTITLASPVGGLQFPRFLHYYLTYHAPILKHLIPSSHFIRSLHEKSYDKNPMELIITTGGFNPMIYEDSDGVVTFAAQTSWKPEQANIIFSNTDHHEILQSADALYYIEKALTI